MRKTFALILILCILTVSLPINSVSARVTNFVDLPKNHWASPYVTGMISSGAVNGYDDGTFRPENNVSRSEWAKLMTQTAGIPLYDSYKTVVENGASDVDESDWFAPYIVTMLPYFDFETKTVDDGKKIVTFEPGKATTRLEIVKSIVRERGFKLSEADTSFSSGFKDRNKFAGDDEKYVALAVENGIITGFNDNTFRPNDKVTRAQACTILYRTYIQKHQGKPYKLSTLAEADIDKPKMATIDSEGNLLFIDATDNCVYKVDMQSRKKALYFDPSKLKHRLDGYAGVRNYSSYIAKQVYYDELSNRIILNGVYQSAEIVGERTIRDGKFTHMYDISKPEEPLLFCVPQFSDEKGYWCNIQTVINEKQIFTGGNFEGFVNIPTGKKSAKYLNHGDSSETVLMKMSGDNMYYLSYDPEAQYCSGAIFKYNSSNEKFEAVSDNYYFDSFGIGKDAFYLKGMDILSKDDNYRIYKIDINNLKVEDLDICLLPEYVECEDKLGLDGLNIAKGNFKSVANYFYVINDTTFVFYDHTANAFRILEKNTGEIVYDVYRMNKRFFVPYEKAYVAKPEPQLPVAYVPTKEVIDFFEKGSWGVQGITLSITHKHTNVFDILIKWPKGEWGREFSGYCWQYEGVLDENGVFTYDEGIKSYITDLGEKFDSKIGGGALALKNDYNPEWNDGGYYMYWTEEDFMFYHRDYLLGL